MSQLTTITQMQTFSSQAIICKIVISRSSSDTLSFFQNPHSFMKATIHPDYLIRTIAGEHILIGCGEQINLSHMLMINETAVFLIRKLQEGIATTEALAQCLTEEYNVTYPKALADTETLIRQLAEQGVVVISE